ncbi:uncharacterized protein LOC116679131 [Etheostoma spectabile]|uniref:uncharacterized protein LOC116679131 n=1 Tax=Etheostoma spectabile TaxID=54343 RepID=UPI0013AEB477|nr:uncharacterized protein LOC116679131 [Etheostoma spectabile]
MREQCLKAGPSAWGWRGFFWTNAPPQPKDSAWSNEAVDPDRSSFRGGGRLQKGWFLLDNLQQKSTVTWDWVFLEPDGNETPSRQSWVVNNVYKETYVIFLLYQHVFSLLYEDGSSIDTRHRMLRVLDTPLLCRPPFHLDKTMETTQSTKGGFSIRPVLHANGSRAYELRLPFQNPAVRWTYVGQGVVQYSIDVNYTLTIVPQKDSYYHLTSIKAQALNMFPPEITAQCSDGGITFTVVVPPHAESIWEVGVGHEPLTSQLAAQRGYRLHRDSFRTTLEIPVFSVGYTYDDVTLSNFYGTFRLLLRDSKTLEVQTSTSKRCIFKTEDMIVCSADGTMAVVTTPTSTWPSVHPDTTTLLDPAASPERRTQPESCLSSSWTPAGLELW